MSASPVVSVGLMWKNSTCEDAMSFVVYQTVNSLIGLAVQQNASNTICGSRG